MLGLLESEEKMVKGNSKLSEVVAFYYDTPKFLKLRPTTQKDYEYQIGKAITTVLRDGRTLGDIQFESIRIKHITEAYNQWLQSGVRTANIRATYLSAVWGVAKQYEITRYTNPVSLLDRQKEKPRKVMWTEEHVIKFLDVAYNDFKWRSVGLIVQMAYEWAQRIGDMRLLKWQHLDLDAQRLDIEQSKRGVDVHLPIGDSLNNMLKIQKEAFGFQEWVAPKPYPRADKFITYEKRDISLVTNDILATANLPSDLCAMDLRRTAITEMVEAGVDIAGIMQVSGHQNPSSVKPYMVNTLAGATTALDKRNKNK